MKIYGKKICWLLLFYSTSLFANSLHVAENTFSENFPTVFFLTTNPATGFVSFCSKV
ncbi:hypothetical protein IT568_06835 [bacterium]|nr:hypothetical protein [bacterium]